MTAPHFMHTAPSREAMARIAFVFALSEEAGARNILAEGRSAGLLRIRELDESSLAIDSLVIDEDMRGCGLGRQAMRDIVEIADATGCDIVLEAFRRPDIEDGGPTFSWYLRCGFEDEGPSNDQGHHGLRRPARDPYPDEVMEP